MTPMNDNAVRSVADHRRLVCAAVLAAATVLVLMSAADADPSWQAFVDALERIAREIHGFWHGALGCGRSAPVAPALRAWRHAAQDAIRASVLARVR
ncbi:MAG TPA: hypothetical protein VMT17_08735 [Anaeromyxobacteraceae bacterium]|nr:hypothetical protein [Anaeromyxobacteraceae bacterium]